MTDKQAKRKAFWCSQEELELLNMAIASWVDSLATCQDRIGAHSPAAQASFSLTTHRLAALQYRVSMELLSKAPAAKTKEASE